MSFCSREQEEAEGNSAVNKNSAKQISLGTGSTGYALYNKTIPDREVHRLRPPAALQPPAWPEAPAW